MYLLSRMPVVYCMISLCAGGAKALVEGLKGNQVMVELGGGGCAKKTGGAMHGWKGVCQSQGHTAREYINASFAKVLRL
jgi:hypothetical protein